MFQAGENGEVQFQTASGEPMSIQGPRGEKVSLLEEQIMFVLKQILCLF